MRYLAITFLALLFWGCIDEYSDTIELYPDGSAMFYASIYPCELDSNLLVSIRENYDSVPGINFDSAWFLQRDSAQSLNFRVSFENLLTWNGNKKIEKDFVGSISLKKIDSLENSYSFERIINANTENEDGFIVPEENISAFILEQMNKDGSSFWDYEIILPTGATLISSEPIDMFVIKSDEPNVLRWKVPVSEAIANSVSFKAVFSLPSSERQLLHFTSLISIIAGCVIMLLAITLLLRKLRKLSTALKKLKDTEDSYKEE